MMTALDVVGSATMYCHVPVLDSKTSWIVGCLAVVALVLYLAHC